MYILRNTLITTLLAAIAMLCAGCSGRNDDKTLSVSIEPQRYILEKIAGDKWKVNTVLANGADPENFDPPVSAIKSVMNSAVYFKMGHMAFEDVLLEKMKKSKNAIRITDTSSGIDLIEGTHDHDHDHGHHSHETDPHTWSSVKNAYVIARNMYRTLAETDPANAGYYKSNYEAFCHELDSLDNLISARLQPLDSAVFVTWHPSLSYFARDYGLRQIAIGSDNKEMSAEAFRKKIDQARNLGARTFIIQPEFDQNRSAQVAAQAGTRTVSVNLLAYDWPEELKKVAEAISHNAKTDNR